MIVYFVDEIDYVCEVFVCGIFFEVDVEFCFDFFLGFCEIDVFVVVVEVLGDCLEVVFVYLRCVFVDC